LTTKREPGKETRRPRGDVGVTARRTQKERKAKDGRTTKRDRGEGGGRGRGRVDLGEVGLNDAVTVDGGDLVRVLVLVVVEPRDGDHVLHRRGGIHNVLEPRKALGDSGGDTETDWREGEEESVRETK
jgi:hypothetical protein